MIKWESADDILDFAIEKEEDAYQFYTDLAGKVKAASMRKIFEEFALEEKGHKAKLKAVKRSGALATTGNTVTDLKIGDYLVAAEPDADITYQQALILAMKQEKAAFKLYMDLAAATDDADLQALLLALAQEEAKHKLRFEVEYDDEILKEN